MKKVLIILLVAGALLTTLVFGAVAGGALAYFMLRTNSAQAAEISPEIVERVAPMPVESGVLVAGVVEGSPADEAGIVRGDILLAVGDTEVNSLSQLHVAVEEQADETETVEITLQHGDERRTVTVTLGDYINQPRLGIETCGQMLGRQVWPPQQDGEGFVLPFDSNGAVITAVVADSPAQAAGLQTGDIVTAVNDQEVTQENSLADIIQSFAPGDEITLVVERQGEILELQVELGENAEDSSLPYLGVRYIPAVGLHGRGERIIPFEKFPFELPEGMLPEGESQPFFGQPFDEMPLLPFDLPEDVQSGAVIVDLTPDSPAESAGLQVGDVIVAAGEETLAGAEQLVEIVQALQPGDELSLELYRSGESEPLMFTVVLAENPDREGQPYLGLRIGDFERILEDHLNPGSGFFHNFPFPEDSNPLEQEIGQSV